MKVHTLLLKTVNFCNLECGYCYVRRGKRTHLPAILSDQIVSRAVHDYLELAIEGRGTGPNGEWMVFLWHGGEPTLAGKEFFQKVLDLQERTGRADFIINSLTSNGTLIDREWCDFLKRYRFRVSISIDGPKSIHDMHRVKKGGESSFDEVMRGIDSLKASDHPFGVMCVISEESANQAEEIFNFFVNSGLKRLTFLPRISEETFLPPNNYSNFLSKIYDLWLESDDPNICIREFENIIHELFGGRAELCEFNGCCGSYLAIDCNGDIYLCDLFIGDESLKVGNILNDSLKTILDSNQTLEKIQMKSQLNQECINCDYFSICKGGCLYRRCLIQGRPSDKDIYCDCRKEIFNHISLNLSKILSRAGKDFLTSPLLY